MSLADGLNKVKLFYGEFAVSSIQQLGGAADVEVVVASANMPIAGDYVYITGNTNAPDGYYTVTGIVDSGTFTINYTGGTGTVVGGEMSLGKELNVYHSDNENIIIEGKKKVRLDKVIIENIIGYRRVLDIDFEAFTSAERLFMYQFVKSDLQRAEVFSTVYTDVVLQDSDVVLELISGFIKATGLKITLIDRNVTARSVGAYTAGETSSDGYYSGGDEGTKIKLTMVWESGLEISRNFSVNLADIYSVKVERHEFNHLDESIGRVNFGFRPVVKIDFGTLGFSPTPTTINTDLAWIKTFVLAPVKRISVAGIFQADVVNDFDEVKVDYLGGFVFAKMLSLNFIGRSVQDNQILPTGVFTLDDSVLGVLDSTTPLG